MLLWMQSEANNVHACSHVWSRGNNTNFVSLRASSVSKKLVIVQLRGRSLWRRKEPSLIHDSKQTKSIAVLISINATLCKKISSSKFSVCINVQ